MSVINIIRKYISHNLLKYTVLIIINLSLGPIMLLYLSKIQGLVNAVIHIDINAILFNTIFLTAVIVVNIFLGRFAQYIQNDLLLSVNKDMRIQFFNRLYKMKLADLDRYRNFKLATIFNNDIQSITNFTISFLPQYLSQVFKFALLLVYIGLQNYLLLLILLIAPIMLFLSHKYGDKSAKENKISFEKKSLLNETTNDILENLHNIRAFNASKYFHVKYKTIEDDVAYHEKKRMFYRNIVWITGVAGYQAIYIIFYVVGGILAFNKLINFSLIVALFVIIDPLVDMIMSLPTILPSLYEARQSVERYEEVISHELWIMPVNTLLKNANKDVIVDQVSYAYDKEFVLNDVSINIGSGEKVALIGRNGSGKSTLLKLIMGYDRNYSGNIMLMNTSIKDLDDDKIVEYVAFLPQEIFLKNGTIRSNIELAVPNADDKSIMHYANIAVIDKEIENMLNGYDFELINNSSNISQGQKQRIGLIISLLKEKPYIFLDECFSSIDQHTASQIFKNIVSISNQTLIMTTHRIFPEIMDMFDKIYLLDKGRIVAFGSSEELRDNTLYKAIEKEGEN